MTRFIEILYFLARMVEGLSELFLWNGYICIWVNWLMSIGKLKKVPSLLVIWKFAAIHHLLFYIPLYPNAQNRKYTEFEPFDASYCLYRVDGNTTVSFCPGEIIWSMKCLGLIVVLLYIADLIMLYHKFSVIATSLVETIVTAIILARSLDLQSEWIRYWNDQPGDKQAGYRMDHNIRNFRLLAFLAVQIIVFVLILFRYVSFKGMRKATQKYEPIV